MRLGMHSNAGPLPVVRLHVALRTGARAAALSAAQDLGVQLLPQTPERLPEVIAAVQASLARTASRQQACDALATLRSAITSPPASPVLAAQLVTWYTMVGDHDAAYTVAHEAIDRSVRYDTMGLLLTWLWHPELLPFRRDVRFATLVERLDMSAYWQVHGPPDDCTLIDGKLRVL
jgi:hypothetical protein